MNVRIQFDARRWRVARSSNGSTKPTRPSVAQALAKNGFNRSIETYVAYTREHPGFHVGDDTFGAWFSSLSDLARANDAVDLCRLWTYVSPRSIDAWTHLGAAHEIANEQKAAMESYRQVLKLDSHNSVAEGRIRSLKLTVDR